MPTLRCKLGKHEYPLVHAPCPHCGAEERVYTDQFCTFLCTACEKSWMATCLPMWTVVEATFHVHPILSDEHGEGIFIDKDVVEYLVRMDVTDRDTDWVPIGCETWYVSDAKLAQRATIKILAVPPPSSPRSTPYN